MSSLAHLRRAALGLDLGGSSAKLGIVAEQGELLVIEQVPFAPLDSLTTVLASLQHALQQLRDRAAGQGVELIGVGCGVPGNLDADRSTVLLNNITALDGFPLRPWLVEQLHLPTVLDNDACMAALAEASLSAPADRTLFVTVGSGIGVVLLHRGVIVRVAHGATGEAGHLIVEANSPQRCPLGCRGCLETVASGRAIEREGQRAAAEGRSDLLGQIRQAKGSLSGADIAAAMAQGDPAARAIIEQAGHWLGLGMASWAAIYQPEQMILGGGVAQAGEIWLQAAVAAMRSSGVPRFTETVRVATARLGKGAGVIGAALAVIQHVSESGVSAYCQ
ncbi:MAG: glucokinase [Chloroflexota bacterium]|nr:MAG: glucokinase [Chloroflexota bacterium]